MEEGKMKDFLTDSEMKDLEAKNHPDFISDEDMAKLQPEEDVKPIEPYDPVETGLRAAINSAMAGYFPQAEAGVRTGSLSSPEYTKMRDELIQRQDISSVENPLSYGAGSIAGIFAPAGAIGKGVGAAFKGAPLAARALGAGAAGLAEMAMQNPGDVPGEVNPLQLEDRAQMIADHPILSTVAAAAPMVGPIAQNFKKGDIAAEAAINALSPKKKLSRELIRSGEGGRVDELGNYALDNKVVGGLNNYEKMYQKASQLQEAAGREIHSINQRSNNFIENYMVQNAGKPLSGVKEYLTKTFTPANYKNEILSDIDRQLEYLPAKDAALKKASDYLDAIWSKGTPDIEQLQKIRTALGQSVKDWAKTNLETPEVQRAWKIIRGHIADATDNEFNFLEQVTKGPDAQRIRQLRKEYRSASTIADNVLDRAAGEMSQKSGLGLLDAGAIGALGGGAAMMTKDPTTAMISAGLGAGIMGAKRLGESGRAGSLKAGLINKVVNHPESMTMQIPAAIASTVSRETNEPHVEGYPLSLTMPVNPMEMMQAGAELEKSDMPPTEKAKRMQLLNKHKRVYLGE